MSRLDKNRTTEKVFNVQPIDIRRNGKPNFRWIDDVEEDLLVLRTKNWRTLAERRLAWKWLLEKASRHGFAWKRKPFLQPGETFWSAYQTHQTVTLPPIQWFGTLSVLHHL
ncbi:hypothetical protein TNCV_4232131 [Trichonephila clavipes]|nr:hypothetical protein TNCV_4232131 [Trichonephila clavipes]